MKKNKFKGIYLFLSVLVILCCLISKTIVNRKFSNVKAYIKTDDKNHYLILNKNGKETPIQTLENDTGSFFEKIRFSPSTRYLIYSIGSVGGLEYFFYDTINNSLLKNTTSESDIITNNEKYVVSCFNLYEGVGDVNGQIISIPDQEIKFDLTSYLNNKSPLDTISCRYNSNSNYIYFEYHIPKSSYRSSTVTYDLTTGKVQNFQF